MQHYLWARNFVIKNSAIIRIASKKLGNWLQSKKIIFAHACMEAIGNYGLRLAEWLIEEFVVSLANPASIKGFAQSQLTRNKADKADAKLIARFTEVLNPEAWVSPMGNIVFVLAFLLSSVGAHAQSCPEDFTDTGAHCLKHHLMGEMSGISCAQAVNQTKALVGARSALVCITLAVKLIIKQSVVIFASQFVQRI